MTVLNDTTSQLNSQQQPTSAEIFAMLAFIVSQTYDPAKRFNSIWIQTRAYLARPEIREYLQKALDRAPHNAVSLPYERLAREKLAATPVTFLSNLQVVEPPAPKRLYKSKSKTKINAYVRIDPELARLAVALRESAVLRLYAVACDAIRQRQEAEGKGYNYFVINDLFEALAALGIEYTPERYRQLIKRGQKLDFWTINAGRAFIRNPQRIAAILTRMAIRRNQPELILADRPGARAVYLRISGSLKEVNAHFYAGWLGANDDPTISRETLMTIFNRSRQGLQEWERLAKIKVTENYAQTKELDDTRIAAHAVSVRMRESAEQSTIGWRWQRTNTYHPKQHREHGHKGQARKVRKAVNAICKAELPAEYMAAAHPLGVRNFDTLKAYRAAWRRDSRADVPLDAYTDYLFLGAVRVRRRGKLIGTWELMGAHREPQTSAGDYEPMPRYQRVQYADI